MASNNYQSDYHMSHFNFLLDWSNVSKVSYSGKQEQGVEPDYQADASATWLYCIGIMNHNSGS